MGRSGGGSKGPSKRDCERLDGYFEDLGTELSKWVSKGRIEAADAGEKRLALARDQAANREALSARFVLRLELRPIAALLVEAPALFVGVELKRRKAQRAIELEYDGATRRLVPPAREACGGPTPQPAACDEAVHLLCEECAPRVQGRFSCGACRKR